MVIEFIVSPDDDRQERDEMWNVEGSWGGSVDTLADVWLLDGDRRVVTERGARRLADAKRAERRSRRRPEARGCGLQTPDVSRPADEWRYEFDPQLEAETLAQIADDRAMSEHHLERHAECDFVEGYLRFLVAEGATSLHVALVGRLLTRLSREVARLGWQRYPSSLLNSRQAELVVAIRSRMVPDEQGTRLLAFFRQLRAWSWVHAEMRSGERSIELAEAEEDAFASALSMTRLDADLLEAALLAASRTDLDVRAAIAALFVLETGIGSDELSGLSADQIVTGEDGRQLLESYRGPTRELSPALSSFAFALVKRNQALEDFSGWSSHDPTLFQTRESVRSRSLAASWFIDSLRRMSRDLWRAGLQRRHWSLRVGGLLAHFERRRGVAMADSRSYAGWSRRVASTIPADGVPGPLRRLPVWDLA